MTKEFDALIQQGTWELVPKPQATNLIGCKWVYRIKRKSNGDIDRYKARLVAKGFHQRPGLDYTQTFSPVVKPTTIRLVLSLALQHNWPLRQLDVNNAFLHGSLSEEVYMQQPPGFIHPEKPHHVCRLRKSIYGLKQAPRAWFQTLQKFLSDYGFVNSTSDSSLFILRTTETVLYILVYVDDIIITGNSSVKVNECVAALAHTFSIKDLGNLHYFLGVEVIQTTAGLFLSQHKYIGDLLERTKMQDAKPVLTPMSTSTPLCKDDGSPSTDTTFYRSTIGSLQYLSLTRPDIAFTVNKLAQFMQRPTERHLTALKRLLRYLKGTIFHGLLLQKSKSSSLIAYSDADWAGNKDDFTSTSAHLVYYGSNLISWKSSKQRAVARSSTEAEYRALANSAAEISWIYSLLTELGVHISQPPLLLCDNLGATYLTHNPVYHSRMKHISIDIHFVRDLVQQGKLKVQHVCTVDQLTDCLTKPLSKTRHQLLRNKIGVTDGTPILRGRVRPTN
jgi:hypothetical protein